MKYDKAHIFKARAMSTNLRLSTRKAAYSVRGMSSGHVVVDELRDYRYDVMAELSKQILEAIDSQTIRDFNVAYLNSQTRQDVMQWNSDAIPAQITFEHFQAVKNLPYSQ